MQLPIHLALSSTLLGLCAAWYEGPLNFTPANEDPSNAMGSDSGRASDLDDSAHLLNSTLLRGNAPVKRNWADGRLLKFKQCGLSTDKMHIQHMWFNPNPPIPGMNFTVKLVGELEGAITYGDYAELWYDEGAGEHKERKRQYWNLCHLLGRMYAFAGDGVFCPYETRNSGVRGTWEKTWMLNSFNLPAWVSRNDTKLMVWKRDGTQILCLHLMYCGGEEENECMYPL